MLVGRDQAYLNQPWVSARTIRVDSTDVGFLDFDISDNEIEALYAKGYAAAEKFLSTWDWDAYLDRFRLMAVDLAAIVPLPATFADNAGAAFAPLAGDGAIGARRADDARHGRGRCRRTAGRRCPRNPCGPRPVGHWCRRGRESGLAGAMRGRRAAVPQEPAAPCPDPRHSSSVGSPASLRDRVIAALRAGSPVVMPVLAVTDSVKAVDGRGSVTGTLDRSTLRAVQYPRGFTVDQLSRLLAGRTSDDFDELDESLRAGTPITLVDGDADAFVVELPRDTAFVEAIIACRHTDPHPADG